MNGSWSGGTTTAQVLAVAGWLGAAALAGCGGSPQPAAGGAGPAPAASGEAPAVGATDASRGSHPEREPALAARAARGLEISPVPIATDGLSPRDRALVGLGSYLVNAASDCAVCHTGPAGFLSGGNRFNLDRAGHAVFSRNLTPDPTTGLHLTWPEFLTAVRTGKDFHPGATAGLVVMPWTTLRWASELDLRAIYAYLRAIPPVQHAVPADLKSGLPIPPSVPFPGTVYTDGDMVRPLGGDHRSFDAARGLAISPLRRPPQLGEDGAEGYGVGSYIANATAHCNDCHTHPDRTADRSRVNTPAWLTGGDVFAVPPPLRPVLRQARSMSANLKGATSGFFAEPGATLQTFEEIIRTGTHADEPSHRPLGWPMLAVAGHLAGLLDDDLQDLYAYVKQAPFTTGPTDVPRQPYARWCQAASDCAAGESCALPTGECVGGACTSDLDCGACQTCGSGACQAPAADSTCVPP